MCAFENSCVNGSVRICKIGRVIDVERVAYGHLLFEMGDGIFRILVDSKFGDLPQMYLYRTNIWLQKLVFSPIFIYHAKNGKREENLCYSRIYTN